MATVELPGHAFLGRGQWVKWPCVLAQRWENKCQSLFSEGWGEVEPRSICSRKSLGKFLENSQNQKMLKDRCQWRGREGHFAVLRDRQKVTFYVTVQVCRALNTQESFLMKTGQRELRVFFQLVMNTEAPTQEDENTRHRLHHPF